MDADGQFGCLCVAQAVIKQRNSKFAITRFETASGAADFTEHPVALLRLQARVESLLASRPIDRMRGGPALPLKLQEGKSIGGELWSGRKCL